MDSSDEDFALLYLAEGAAIPQKIEEQTNKHTHTHKCCLLVIIL